MAWIPVSAYSKHSVLTTELPMQLEGLVVEQSENVSTYMQFVPRWQTDGCVWALPEGGKGGPPSAFAPRGCSPSTRNTSL